TLTGARRAEHTSPWDDFVVKRRARITGRTRVAGIALTCRPRARFDAVTVGAALEIVARSHRHATSGGKRGALEVTVAIQRVVEDVAGQAATASRCGVGTGVIAAGAHDAGSGVDAGAVIHAGDD